MNEMVFRIRFASINVYLLLLLLSLFPVGSLAQLSQRATFTNPLTSKSAADPWIVRHDDGYYYFTATTGKNIFVLKSKTITGIDKAARVTVWTPPASGPQSKNIWAPELHFLQGKWYIYFAADDGRNENHRMYVLESVSADPQGAYIERGKIYDAANDKWAIDGTVLEEDDGKLYFVWSGWAGAVDKVAQNLYIAAMSNPWTIMGERVLISRPERAWEGWINEGPEVLKRNGKIFIVYSANGSWTPDYCLGLLMNTGESVLSPGSWTKSIDPVFARQPQVFGPGHSTFAKSFDGTQDWIIYHANDNPKDGWRNRRPRAQRFTWNPDGTPNFGYPVAPRFPLAAPAGELPTTHPSISVVHGSGTGLQAEYFDNPDLTNLKLKRTDSTVNYVWGIIGKNGAPADTVSEDTFSVRWRGQVEPRYSEEYAFYTYSDDGIRVWVNNKLIIDNWIAHQATVNSGTIKLAAGRRYDICVEYYDNTGSAIARLEWSSASQPLEVIPTTQLYPQVIASTSRIAAVWLQGNELCGLLTSFHFL